MCVCLRFGRECSGGEVRGMVGWGCGWIVRRDVTRRSCRTYEEEEPIAENKQNPATSIESQLGAWFVLKCFASF